MEKVNEKYFIGIALLKEETFNFEKLKKDLKNNWGIDTTVDIVDNNLIFNIGAMIATLTLMDVPLPAQEIETATLKNYRWTDGVSVTKTHKAHLIVSVIGQDTSIHKGKLLVKIIESCCDQSNVLGIYSNSSVLRPEIYKAFASMMKDGLVPFYNLVWLNVYKNSDDSGINVYTNGLDLLDNEEIEIINSQKEADKIHELLAHLCTYILDRNLELKDGEILDYNNEKITITYGDGIAINKKSFKLNF